MTEIKSISLAASQVSWDDVDSRSKNLGFNDRSSYIQYLIERDIFRKRMRDIRFTEIMMILGLALCMVLIVVLR